MFCHISCWRSRNHGDAKQRNNMSCSTRCFTRTRFSTCKIPPRPETRLGLNVVYRRVLAESDVSDTFYSPRCCQWTVCATRLSLRRLVHAGRMMFGQYRWIFVVVTCGHVVQVPGLHSSLSLSLQSLLLLQTLSLHTTLVQTPRVPS